MNAQEYIDKASSMITPRTQHLITEGDDYLALGLIGETGEVCEHLKKSLRDDGGLLTGGRREKLIHELGDVLWYTAMLAKAYGDQITFDVAPRRLGPIAHARILATCVSDVVTLPTRILACIAGIAQWCGVTLEQVADANIEKLVGRHERGTEHGSGDDR